MFVMGGESAVVMGSAVVKRHLPKFYISDVGVLNYVYPHCFGQCNGLQLTLMLAAKKSASTILLSCRVKSSQGGLRTLQLLKIV